MRNQIGNIFHKSHSTQNAMNLHLVRGNVYEDEHGQFIAKCGCCDLQFKTLSKLQEHIKEIENSPKITDLPPECLTRIFRYLAPNQLATCSQVCTKFKATSEKVFQLYCDPGAIEIEYDVVILTKSRHYEDDDCEAEVSFQLQFKCRSQYQTVFPSSIRRLLVFEAITGYKEVFEFIRTNCSENLISLIINDSYIDPKYGDDIYGELIQNHLKHLKHLRVKNPSHKNLYEQLLKYTKRLQTLNVINYCLDCRGKHDGICAHFDYSWMNHSYPKLESIFLHTTDNRVDLMPMIRRHPKLRNVACNSVQSIRSIFESDIKFKCIAIVFGLWDYHLNHFRQHHKDFVKFGRSKKFEKFELCFTSHCDFNAEDAKRIEQIPNVTGLHCSEWYICTITESYLQLPSIEKLCIESCYDELLPEIDKCFPNLSELRINGGQFPWNNQSYHTSSSLFKGLAKTFFSDSSMFKNLRQLHYENDESVNFTLDDLKWINAARSVRPNPFKIIVYLDPVHFHKFNENVIELQYIEIRPWIYGGCELCVYVGVGL